MMKSASRRLVIILLFVASALTYGLATPALCDAGEAEDPHVRKRLGEVSNEGEQKEKIDHPGLEDEKVPDYVEVGPTVTLIQSLSYEPPTDWSFDEFPEPNPYRFVDIHHNTPPDSLTKRVAPPTWEHDTAGCVRIEGTWNKESVPDWPLRCEGNLECGEGGQGGEPADWFWAAKTMTADVDIKEDSISQGREWWPENSKLLITAEHGLLAIGTPTSPTAIYVWEDHLGDQDKFDPNNTPKNPALVGHWTKFTAPDVATPPEDRDNHKIQVQYKLYDEPIDQEPLNLTRPASATAEPMQVSKTVSSLTRLKSTGTINIIDAVIKYTVADQFGDSIKDSDRGDKHWIMREVVPWQSPLPAVLAYCQGIPTNTAWHVPAEEANGYFNDNLQVDALPASALSGAYAEMNLITVDPHDWYVGVGGEGSLSAGEEQIAGNHFVVHITQFSENPTTITVSFTVSYQVTLN